MQECLSSQSITPAYAFTYSVTVMKLFIELVSSNLQQVVMTKLKNVTSEIKRKKYILLILGQMFVQ